MIISHKDELKQLLKEPVTTEEIMIKKVDNLINSDKLFDALLSIEENLIEFKRNGNEKKGIPPGMPL